MNSNNKKWLLIVLLIIIVVTVTLRNDIYAKDAGISKAQFLKIGIGARATGLCNAFCGISDDISAMYWNPAGISQLTQIELMSTHVSWLQDVNYEYLSCVYPKENQTVLGMSLGMLNINDIKRYDKDNNFIGMFTAKDMVMSCVYSKMFNRRIAAGIKLKYIKQRLDDKTTSDIAVDIGGLYHTGIRNLIIGATVYNIEIDTDDRRRRRMPDDKLPFRIRFGAGYQWRNKYTFGIDIDMPNDGKKTTSIGVEYLLPPTRLKFDTVVRAGYRVGADTGMMSFGFGIYGKKYLFDYAFIPYGELGRVHHISTSIRFGTPKPKQKLMLIEPVDKKHKATEPIISWIDIQRWILGLFIEERHFPEYLKKKKKKEEKRLKLPGMEAPEKGIDEEETQKGLTFEEEDIPEDIEDFDEGMIEDMEFGEEETEEEEVEEGEEDVEEVETEETEEVDGEGTEAETVDNMDNKVEEDTVDEVEVTTEEGDKIPPQENNQQDNNDNEVIEHQEMDKTEDVIINDDQKVVEDEVEKEVVHEDDNNNISAPDGIDNNQQQENQQYQESDTEDSIIEDNKDKVEKMATKMKDIKEEENNIGHTHSEKLTEVPENENIDDDNKVISQKNINPAQQQKEDNKDGDEYNDDTLGADKYYSHEINILEYNAEDEDIDKIVIPQFKFLDIAPLEEEESLE